MSERGEGGFEAFLQAQDRGGVAGARGMTPRRLMEERRRNLILRGALDVFGEKGFAHTTVQDLIDEVGISRATFYRYFSDREACLVALNDSVLRWLEEEARQEIASAAGWPSQVRAVTERLVGLVAGDPRIGRACGPEAMLMSAEIGARQRAGLDALVAGLRSGRALSRHGEELPAFLEDCLVAGGVSLATWSVFRELRSNTHLGADVAEFILIPYLGAARARSLVRGT